MTSDMNSDSTKLLQALSAGVRVHGATTQSAGVSGSVASGQFADLLRKAQSGELASSRPVSIAKDAGVKLTEDQLAQISLAADKAEVAGIRSALVVIEGQAITLDVANRLVTGPADLDAGVIGGVDGFINLSTQLLSGAEKSAGLSMPATTGAGPSLATLLASRERDSAQSGRAA
jgi:hypothetical protein